MNVILVWVAAHKFLTAVIALFVFVALVPDGDDEQPAATDTQTAPTSHARRTR